MDIGLDRAAAERVVSLVDPSARVSSVSRLTGGGLSGVFEVLTDESRSFVVKVYADDFAWKMQKEAFVYGLIRERKVGVPVPDVLATDGSREVLPRCFVVLSKLEGQHLLSLLEQLDDSELVAINRQIGALLRMLHEIELDAFGYVGTHGIVESHATNADYMRFQFAKKAREFVELGGDSELGIRIERYVRERDELLVGCTQPVFCHNDCHEGNVLVLSGSVSGLLDFENVLAGDPLLDIAKAYCYSRRRSVATLDALVDGYGELREGWRDAIELYVLYHRLELWDWFATIGETEPLAGLAAELAQTVRPTSRRGPKVSDT